MEKQGFIIIWRKMQDTSFYKDSFAFHLASHLLLRVNHEDKNIIFNGESLVIKRGSTCCGRFSLSQETGIKPSTVRNKVALLKNVGFLDIKSNNKFSIITILNYDNYQNSKSKKGHQNGQPEDSQRTTKGQPEDTNKECNNENNEKEYLYVDFEKSALTLWNSFCDKHPVLSKITTITDSRRKQLKARFSQQTFKDFQAILTAIDDQPFLLTGNPDSKEHKNWKVSFEWLIRNDTNHVKILEKKYKDTQPERWA